MPGPDDTLEHLRIVEMVLALTQEVRGGIVTTVTASGSPALHVSPSRPARGCDITCEPSILVGSVCDRSHDRVPSYVLRAAEGRCAAQRCD